MTCENDYAKGFQFLRNRRARGRPPPQRPPPARSRHWAGSAGAARNRAKLSRASPQQPGRCTGVSHAWCPAAPPRAPQPPAPPLARGGTRHPRVRCMRTPLDAGAADRETAARARLGHKSTTIFVRRPSSNTHCIMRGDGAKIVKKLWEATAFELLSKFGACLSAPPLIAKVRLVSP